MNTSLLLFLGDIGGSELLLILVVILIFFGAKRIPELARGLGTGIREFKDATQNIRSEIENADQPKQPQQYSNNAPNYQAPPAPPTYSATFVDPQTAPPAATPPVASPASDPTEPRFPA